MKNKFIKAVFTLLFLVCLGACEENDGDKSARSKDYLSALDNDLKRAPEYGAFKREKIDSLKKLVRETEDITRSKLLLTSLANLYRQYDSDSAIYYAIQANATQIENEADSIDLQAKLALVDALGTSGIFSEAFSILDEIKKEGYTDKRSKTMIWLSSRILYSYAISYLNENNIYTGEYKRKYFESDDSLLNNLPETDYYARFIKAERLVSERKYEEAKRELQNIMDDSKMSDNIYGMSAYQLAEIYKNTGEFTNYQKSLALAARSDLMGAIREGKALPTLANSLYETGDLERAYRYINFALEEASTANIRMRTVEITANMSMIEGAYKKEIDAHHNALIAFISVACGLLLISSVLSAVLYRSIKGARRNEKRLSLLSLKLQDYIGNFIGLAANYSTRLEQLGKLVTRKIKAAQYEDLIKLLGNGRFAEEDNEEFYRLIDKAILDIFPDFAKNVNTLLKPEERIDLTELHDNLTPELRIFACVRLGIDQSSDIAKILHYSVNTVYSYRNRMRNKAINRETFDKDILKIGSYEERE